MNTLLEVDEDENDQDGPEIQKQEPTAFRDLFPEGEGEHLNTDIYSPTFKNIWLHIDILLFTCYQSKKPSYYNWLNSWVSFYGFIYRLDSAFSFFSVFNFAFVGCSFLFLGESI